MRRSVVAIVCLLAGFGLAGSLFIHAYGVHQEAKLLASDGQDEDRFGFSALDGDTAVVTAWRDEDNGYESGSAYVFNRSGDRWVEQVKLLPSDGDERDRFGRCVGIDGDTAVISAIWDGANGEHAGAAYIFLRTGGVWSEQIKFLASDGTDGDLFGQSVELDGNTEDGDGCSAGCRLEHAVPASSPIGVLLLILALAGSGAVLVRRITR